MTKEVLAEVFFRAGILHQMCWVSCLVLSPSNNAAIQNTAQLQFAALPSASPAAGDDGSPYGTRQWIVLMRLEAIKIEPDALGVYSPSHLSLGQWVFFQMVFFLLCSLWSLFLNAAYCLNAFLK